MMFKKDWAILFVVIFTLFCSTSFVLAQTEGIPIQKDIFLGTPIYGPEDLPEEITLALYESQDALMPIGSQTFKRGQYTVDFEFSKSDGITSGNVARVNAEFTQRLNFITAEGESVQPKEIWAALEVAGTEIGPRTKVADETLVQLLLASDASIATYLTLAYEGDDNPITTIYRDLPLSSLSADPGTSANEYITSLFSTYTPEERIFGSTSAPYWEFLNNNIYYPNGNVGIGTGNTAPDRDLSVKNSSDSGSLNSLPTISVANTYESTGGKNDFSFASFEFSGDNRGVIGEFFADGSGWFLDGTPCVVFRSSTNSPLLLGTNLITRMILTTSGRVGIGTTAPSYKLHVADGDIALDNNEYIRFADSSGNYGSGLHMSTADSLILNNGKSDGKIYLTIGGLTGLSIGNQDSEYEIYSGNLALSGTNGPVYANNGVLTMTNPSSQEYKEEIEPIDLQPERILELKPKSFTWKENRSEDFGYIAEDIKEVVPELYRDDGRTKGYDVAKLPFYIIELIKKQQAAINSLKAELDDLKNQVATGN